MLARGGVPGHHLSDHPDLAPNASAIPDAISSFNAMLAGMGAPVPAGFTFAQYQTLATIDPPDPIIVAIRNNPDYAGYLAAINAAMSNSAQRTLFEAQTVSATAHSNFLAAHGISFAAFLALDPIADAAQIAAITGTPTHLAVLSAQTSYEAALRTFAGAEHNHRIQNWSINHGMIPRVQKNLDRIVNSVVTMLNDALTGGLRGEDGEYLFPLLDANGEPILDANGNIQPRAPWNNETPPGAGIPLFVRRADLPTSPIASPGIEDPNNIHSIFTIRNLEINPLLLQEGGHNLLALSLSGAPGDTDLLVALQEVWQSDRGPYAVMIGNRATNVQNAYIRLTNQISVEVHEAIRFVDAQTVQVLHGDSRRQAVKGVSMDEELQNMLRFQYAFQASARMLNVIDSMIDRVINGTGRAGL
jgi:hypothetical protein